MNQNLTEWRKSVICKANGCRRLEVKHELDYGNICRKAADAGIFSITAVTRVLKRAKSPFKKRLTQLGNEGWEIVGEPNLNFEFVNVDEYNKFENKSVLFTRENTKAVYFKRFKTQ